MKVTLVFVCLVAGICASVLPGVDLETAEARNARIVTDSIISAIEDVSQDIKDAGLDPLHVKKETFAYALPVPVIFNAAAFVEEVLSTGLSEIIINNMNYSILWSRLDFDISLPHIYLSARVADGEVTLFGETLRAQSDGSINIRGISVVGEVRVSIGIISGISISSVTVDFSIGSITTNIRLAIQGVNYSEEINTILSSTIPEMLDNFSDEMNELIGIVLKDAINDSL